MIEHITRGVKFLVFFALAWLLIWVLNNAGCNKIEGTEMEPTMKKDQFKVTLTSKRNPEDLAIDDIVFVEYKWPGRTEETLAGRVFGKPGDLIYVERKIVSMQGVLEPVEARREKPSKEDEDKFVPVVVPRDMYFILCDNKRDAATYDSRGVGPFGMWAVKGKINN